MNNNTFAIIIAGILIAAAIIFGSMMVIQYSVQPMEQEPIYVEQAQPPVVPQHYHSANEFWYGYRDGYRRLLPADDCPEYLSGYHMGRRDRRHGCHDYYDHHCPHDFHVRVPGFHLHLR